MADNGDLKQCRICGSVFACPGYSVVLSDREKVLDDLEYDPVCPVCYASILRAVVIREDAAKGGS